MEKIVGELIEKIEKLSHGKEPLIIAIDGRCASGKTTLAARLKEALNCAVFHMDDFFPRPEQRTPQRLSAPGGNVDWERFLDEVILPLRSGKREIRFRPFDCDRWELGPEVIEMATPIVVVEGSYSCHPKLREYYDLRVFLSVSQQEQLRRIALRNGDDGLRQFVERWIPMEELYFRAFDVAAQCELILIPN